MQIALFLSLPLILFQMCISFGISNLRCEKAKTYISVYKLHKEHASALEINKISFNKKINIYISLPPFTHHGRELTYAMYTAAPENSRITMLWVESDLIPF